VITGYAGGAEAPGMGDGEGGNWIWVMGVGRTGEDLVALTTSGAVGGGEEPGMP
jgi:hypothetical protein